jgi:hypothetical protein
MAQEGRKGCLLLFVAAIACGSSRDYVPETHEVHGVAPPPREETGYEHIARRPLGVVGLAEARGLDPAAVARVVDRLADSLETCAEELTKSGKLVEGAARIAAEVSPDGTPVGLNLKVAPGAAVTANALLCFITPFKLTTFPAAPGGATRGLAVEASWGPSFQAPMSAPLDGG